MKVKFLKDHNRHKANDIADILPEAANYYIRCNVAVAVIEDKEVPVEKPAPKKAAKKK